MLTEPEKWGPHGNPGGLSMVMWIRMVNRSIAGHPIRAALLLAVGAAIAYVSYVTGLAMFGTNEEATLFGRFVAWPGGTFPPLALGAAVLGVLLIPDGHLDGRWRWVIAIATWWIALVFALFQLLDDHLMGHAGTENPLGVAIPAPYQDLLELPMIATLTGALGVVVLTLPFRLWKRIRA